MLDGMWPHFWHLVAMSGSAACNDIGTKPFGVIFFACIFIVTQIVLLCWRGWAAMRLHWVGTVALDVGVLALGFVGLWGWNILKTVYDDHQYLVGKVSDVRSQTQQSLSGSTNALNKTILSLQHDKSALAAEIEKRKHSMMVSDPAFQNTLHLLQLSQRYKDSRRGQICVTYITAPPQTYQFAFAIQQIIGAGPCAMFGPSEFDLHSETDAEKLAMQDAQSDFIICHVSEGDMVGESFCGDLANELPVKLSYRPLPTPAKLYHLDRGAGSEKIVWLQFGTNAQWKSQLYGRNN
jgi:hypothetical protein